MNTFNIKTVFFLLPFYYLLTPEKIKSLENTKSKITKTENGKNVRYLKINKLVLVHRSIVNNNYQQSKRVYKCVSNK